MVKPPAPPHPPEVGRFVHFEHVNFRYQDHRLAKAYFILGLGFTVEPYRQANPRNMWVNVGTQQFHLPLGEPTPWPGEVCVAVPDLARTAQSLKDAERWLEGTEFRFAHEDGTLATRDPYGRAVRVYDSHQVSTRGPVGIPRVRLDVPPGTAPGIARFYREVMRCPAELAGRKGAQEARVQAGPHQVFQFAEAKGAQQAPVHNNHVAVYVTDYWELYDTLGTRDLIMEPVGIAREQFRFSDIVDLDSGTLLYRLEHEIRSLYHPDFLHPLVNRLPVEYLVD